MITWIVIGVVVVLLLYGVAIYNRLVRLRALVHEGFSGITVQLRRRADLVPNLVETVKGYATHERETLDAVTAHRADAIERRQRRRHRPGRQCHDRHARAAVRRGRGLSRAQGRRQFPPVAERTQRVGRRASVGAALLQRHRPRPQHPRLLLPRHDVRRPLGFKEEPYYEDADAGIQSAPKVEFQRP